MDSLLPNLFVGSLAYAVFSLFVHFRGKSLTRGALSWAGAAVVTVATISVILSNINSPIADRLPATWLLGYHIILDSSATYGVTTYNSFMLLALPLAHLIVVLSLPVSECARGLLRLDHVGARAPL